MQYATHLLGVLLALSAPAAAQWSDNFDSYANTTLLDNVGGWFGWDNMSANAGTVTNAQARSAPHSVVIANATDAVQPNLGATSGRWVLTLWQYIPTGGLTADTYVILNNVYNHGGPYAWTGQYRCDPNTNTVVDDLRTAGDVPQPIVFDQWIEWRIEIDLDRNTSACYYNNQLVSKGTYNQTVSSSDPIALDNLDLFTTGGTCYYDDIALSPATDDFGVTFCHDGPNATSTATFWIDEPGAANGAAAILYAPTDVPPYSLPVVLGQIYLNPGQLIALPGVGLDGNGRGALTVTGYPAVGVSFQGWFQAFSLPSSGPPLRASDPVAAADGDDAASKSATISYNHDSGKLEVELTGPVGSSANISHVDMNGTRTAIGNVATGGGYTETRPKLTAGEKYEVHCASTGKFLTGVAKI